MVDILVNHNYRPDMVFSSMKVKSAQSIIWVLITQDSWTDADILACVHKRCQKPCEEILEAVKGIELSSASKSRLKMLLKHIDYFRKQISDISISWSNLTAKRSAH